jgi:hypothetical protein
MSSAAMFFTWSVERSSRLFGPSDYEQFGVVHLDSRHRLICAEIHALHASGAVPKAAEGAVAAVG